MNTDPMRNTATGTPSRRGGRLFAALMMLAALAMAAAIPAAAYAQGRSADGAAAAGANALPAPVLNAAASGASQIRLSVSAVRGADTYRIEGADDASFADPRVISASSDKVAVDAGLEAGRMRYYRARAEAAGGRVSPWSIVRFEAPAELVYPAKRFELATGFGLRRINPDYQGPAIQVMRARGGATRDIGFVGQELDLAAIEAFAGGMDVVVTRFYDQVERGAYVPQYTNDLPVIARDGRVLLDETSGRPYVDMVGDGEVEQKYFRRETPLSTPIDKAGSAVMLCVEVREQSTGSHNQGAFGPAQDARTLGALGAWQGQFSTPDVTGVGAPFQQYTRHRTWHGALFLDGSQTIFAGARVVGRASNPVDGSFDQPYLLAGNPWRFSEALIFRNVSTPEDYLERLWAADQYWQAAPTRNQYALTDKMERQYRFQGVIVEWLSQRTPRDFVVHAIGSLGGNQLTVLGADWTHLKPGHVIYAHDRKLTLAAAPTLTADGKDTLLAVNESTAGLEVGQQVVFRPAYDGTFADPEQVANWSVTLGGGGDHSLMPGINGRADARWYAWDTGEPSVTPRVLDWAVLDRSRPQSPQAKPDQLEVRGGDDAQDRKIALVRISLEGLSSPPSLTLVSFFNDLGDEDNVKPYLGLQVYENLMWDSQSLTWNTLPDAIDLSRKYDDIESITPDREQRTFLVFNVDQKLREAYENGATSVTLVLYNSGDQYEGAKKTRRTIILDGPAAAHPPRIELYQAYGLVATDRLRVPDVLRGAYNYGGGWQVAAWTRPELDFPYNGGPGNPFVDNDAMKRRALVVDLANAVQLTTQGNIYDWTRYYGGYLLSLSQSLRFGGDVLPYEVRYAAKQLLLHLAESGRRAPYDAGANANMDTRSAEGAMVAYTLFDQVESDARQQLVESAKFIMLRNRHGDPLTDEAIWHKEGNIYEGRTPEGSYNNRSMSHLVDGRAVAWGEPAFDWVDEMIRRMAQFQERQFGIDPDGWALDTSGYSGRTIDAVLGGQYHSSSKKIMGVLYPQARWHLTDWGGGGGFTVAESGEAAAKSVQRALDRFGDFTILTSTPPVWDGKSSWQARVPEPPPVQGWWSQARAWHEQNVPELYPVFHPDSQEPPFVEVRPEDGHADWFIIKAGDEANHWGAFIDVRQNSGAYGGGFGGVHMLWSENYGVVLSSRRPGGEISHDKLMDGVIGRDDDGKLFSFYQGVRKVEADTEVQLGAGSVRHSFEVTDTDKDVLSGGASWQLQRTYTRLTEQYDGQDGLRIHLQMNYQPGQGGQRDRIDELWWSLPLAAGAENHAAALELSYWDKDAWVAIPPNTPATAQEWKLTRNDRSFWLRFGSPVTVKLLPRTTINRTVGHPLLINLHPQGGASTAPIPSRISQTLVLTQTDPGYKSTAVSPSLSFPKHGETLPVGGLWQIRGELKVPDGVDVQALFFEYSTDGGATWRSIASLDPSTGRKADAQAGLIVDDGDHVYTYVGDDVAIPAGLTDVRIRSVGSGGDERTQTLNVFSTQPTVVLREDFNVEQDAPLDAAYPLDVNTTGNAIYVPKGAVIVDAESGTATARSHEVWYNQVRINVGTVNFITSIRLNPGPKGEGGGLFLRSASYYQNVRGMVEKGRLSISQVMKTIDTVNAPIDMSESYILRAQSIGSAVTFSVWNSDATQQLASYTRFGGNPGQPAVGFGFQSNQVSFDDWTIETFPDAPAK